VEDSAVQNVLGVEECEVGYQCGKSITPFAVQCRYLTFLVVNAILYGLLLVWRQEYGRH